MPSFAPTPLPNRSSNRFFPIHRTFQARPHPSFFLALVLTLFAPTTLLQAQTPSPQTKKPSPPTPRRKPHAKRKKRTKRRPQHKQAKKKASKHSKAASQLGSERKAIHAALHSNERSKRHQAILWLQARNDETSTKALLTVIQHPDPETRWWAVAALRSRIQQPTVQTAFLQRLQFPETDLRVRLNLLRALGEPNTPKFLPAIRPSLQDKRPLLREAACRAFARQYSPTHAPIIQLCLNDVSLLVQRTTASQLLQAKSTVPPRLKQSARRLLQHRQTTQEAAPLSFLAQRNRLRQYKRGFLQQRSQLQRRKTRLARYFDKQGRKCMNDALRQQHNEFKSFQEQTKLYIQAIVQGHWPKAKEALSRALIARRRATNHTRAGIRCRYKNRPKRYVNRTPTGVFLDGLPLHIYTSKRKLFRIALRFLHDNATNALREDLHPPLRAPRASPPEFKWDALLETDIALSWNQRFGRAWILYARNALSAQLRTQWTELSSIGNDLNILLSYGQKSSTSHRLFFVKERFHINPKSPMDQGSPDFFEGRRWLQELTLGGGLTWGSRTPSRRKKWEFKAAYRNQVERPEINEELAFAKQWAPRMHHLAWLKLQRTLFFSSIRLGLHLQAEASHFFGDTAQIPAAVAQGAATLQIGNPDRGLSAQGQFGIARVLPFLDPSATTALQEQTNRTSFVYNIHFRGTHRLRRILRRYQLPRNIYWHWNLLYQYRIGPSIRPNAAFFQQHHLQADLFLGGPQLARLFWTRNYYLRSGVAWYFTQYPSQHLPHYGKEFLHQSRFTIFAQLGLSFSDEIQLSIGDRLEWLNHEAMYSDLGLFDTLFRNVFYVELSFTWRGL